MAARPQDQASVNNDRYSVAIVASGRSRASGLVHAVTVTQPVQSWTVLRSHEEFVQLRSDLSNILSGVPACPAPSSATDDLEAIVQARNEMQEWLTEVLLHPGAPLNPSVRNFLIFNANMIPPQFEGVTWINFATSGAEQPAEQSSSTSPAANSVGGGGGGDVGEMEMEDMYFSDDRVVAGVPDEDVDEEYEILPASERYKPTDQEVTYEDQMEIMNDEVTMVDDVGSLAQSMGASHLGRSLQLQAQMGSYVKQAAKLPTSITQNHGVTLGNAATPRAADQAGGIGTAVEQVGQGQLIQGLGDGFHRTAPISAPRLDSFHLIRVIGEGSFGKVILVKEKQTGEMFALKVLKKASVVRRNQVEHTKTERSVLGYVDHPFIVGMKMAFQSKDKLYFVLDYCAGGELFFHLGRLGRFPEHQACFYAAEITLAISYVHSLDIVYRDLKPENVLLDARGHIRLTDFGLSKEGINSSSSGAYSFCGTPEYLAPEILNRQGHGRAVDWWSLGALLYEMLTGLPPFYCQDRNRLFNKIMTEELRYPMTLSPAAKNLLRGLLTKDPKKRLGSGDGDAEEIKQHEFFRRIHWDKLARGELKAPWQPEIKGSLDTSQFDKEFTNKPIISPQSMQRAPGFGTSVNDNLFENFTFQDKMLHGPKAATGHR